MISMSMWALVRLFFHSRELTYASDFSRSMFHLYKSHPDHTIIIKYASNLLIYHLFFPKSFKLMQQKQPNIKNIPVSKSQCCGSGSGIRDWVPF